MDMQHGKSTHRFPSSIYLDLPHAPIPHTALISAFVGQTFIALILIRYFCFDSLLMQVKGSHCPNLNYVYCQQSINQESMWLMSVHSIVLSFNTMCKRTGKCSASLTHSGRRLGCNSMSMKSWRHRYSYPCSILYQKYMGLEPWVFKSNPKNTNLYQDLVCLCFAIMLQAQSCWMRCTHRNFLLCLDDSQTTKSYVSKPVIRVRSLQPCS